MKLIKSLLFKRIRIIFFLLCFREIIFKGREEGWKKRSQEKEEKLRKIKGGKDREAGRQEGRQKRGSEGGREEKEGRKEEEREGEN